MIGELVARLIAAGTPPEVAAVVVSEAFAAGVATACPQISVDMSAEKRRAKDRLRKQIERENPQISADIHENPQMSKSASISKDSKKDKRGTRIDVGWTPSAAERAFGKQEGFSEFEIDREAQKFRDYWTACAGAKGVKLDWSATWRQWIRNSADRLGKRPAAVIDLTAPGYYAAADSPQIDAWDRHNREKHGKGLPRDRAGGWRVASEWPPEAELIREAASA